MGDQPDDLLESAVWTADLGVYEWDVRTDRVRWLNRWCECYNIDPCEGERHGERWRSMVHPEDRVSARREFDEHVAGRRERYEAEYRIQTLSGGWRWIRNRAYVIRSPEDGREERMVGACVDVDERKRTELALGRTQLKLEALAAAAPIWMVLTDADGMIEFVNRPMQCLALDPVVGRNIVSLFAEPAEAARIDEFRRALIKGGDAQTHTMMLEDGRALTTWAQPILEAGRVVGIASVTADVSERQNRERELLAAVNREQRRFGRDLHDGLGQELTGIAMLLQAAATAPNPDPVLQAGQLRSIVGYVNRSIVSARDLARGLSPLQVVGGSLSGALQRLAQDAGGQVPIRVNIDSQCDERLIDEFSADHLYRIAQEAVVNALRHSGCEHVAIEMSQANGMLTLDILDDGRGISTPSSSDSGLGVRLMEYRARMLGGSLRTASASGGTRVEVRMPLRQAAPG
jgi:signal transduction histidine kinase